MTIVVENIEKLRNKDPVNYWKKLYELEQTDYSNNKIPELIFNENKQLVSGIEATKIWGESFRMLGLDNIKNTENFDNTFYHKINMEITNMLPEDNDFLDQPITLQEVQQAFKKLKRGKLLEWMVL